MDHKLVSRRLLGPLAVLVLSTSVSAGGAVGGTIGQIRNASPKTVPAAATCARGARPCPVRIAFAPGAFSGQAHSQLAGIHSQKWFVVHATAGQTMIVIVEGAGATRGLVFFPDGGSSGQPGGRVYDGNVPTTGDYRIRVTESPMGEGWSGSVDVVAVIY